MIVHFLLLKIAFARRPTDLGQHSVFSVLRVKTPAVECALALTGIKLLAGQIEEAIYFDCSFLVVENCICEMANRPR